MMKIQTLDEQLQKLPITLTSAFCMGIGLLLSLATFIPYLDAYPKLKPFFIGIGCSLIASSIAIFFTSKYTLRRNRVKELTERWGIYGIYTSRQSMNNDSNVELANMSNNLDIMAWGLSSLRSQHDQLIRNKAKKGLKIRIIAPDPDSPYVTQRSIEEEGSEDHIKIQIGFLKTWIEDIQKESGNDNIEIRFYSSLPQDHYMRVDGNIYIGPYFYKKLSQQTVSFSFKQGEMFNLYTTYFDDLWNNNQFCVTKN